MTTTRNNYKCVVTHVNAQDVKAVQVCTIAAHNAKAACVQAVRATLNMYPTQAQCSTFAQSVELVLDTGNNYVHCTAKIV
jgi:hypothetical protein